jgi:hypothetical protein
VVYYWDYSGMRMRSPHEHVRDHEGPARRAARDPPAEGAAIFAVGVSRVLAAAINGHTTRRLPETLLGLVVPVVIILYMLKFSKSYPDRVTHQQANVPASHPGS